MPARIEEVHHAEEEGIQFEFLTAPTEVLGNEKGWVKGLKCIRMELGEPDDSGRRRPVPIEGSEFLFDCDLVIVAIGINANPLLSGATPDLKLNKWGYIEANENLMTSISGRNIGLSGSLVSSRQNALRPSTSQISLMGFPHSSVAWYGSPVKSSKYSQVMLLTLPPHNGQGWHRQALRALRRWQRPFLPAVRCAYPAHFSASYVNVGLDDTIGARP